MTLSIYLARTTPAAPKSCRPSSTHTRRWLMHCSDILFEMREIGQKISARPVYGLSTPRVKWDSMINPVLADRRQDVGKTRSRVTGLIPSLKMGGHVLASPWHPLWSHLLPVPGAQSISLYPINSQSPGRSNSCWICTACVSEKLTLSAPECMCLYILNNMFC
jgi:hypothetical protein